MQDEMSVSERAPKQHTAAHSEISRSAAAALGWSAAEVCMQSAFCTILMETYEKELPTGEICFLHEAWRSYRCVCVEGGERLEKGAPHAAVPPQCNYKQWCGMLLPQLSWGAQLFYAQFKTVTPPHSICLSAPQTCTISDSCYCLRHPLSPQWLWWGRLNDSPF